MATVILHHSRRAPVVTPAPAPIEIQAERQRLAERKREVRAKRLKKGFSHG